MARKPRIEFAGALYHVINRGNYRQDLFSAPGTAQAFEKTLFEVSERCGWEVGAYCIMSNHYHLALATPKGNLVEGMHWLQSTFANRFNKFIRETGHVFQGRYKAILVEPGEHWTRVVSYIHLNPVRSGITSVVKLEEYPWSSFPKYLRKRNRSPVLVCEDWLSQLDGLRDTAGGWRAYRQHLQWVEEMDPEEKAKDCAKMSRGWILGTKAFRKAVWEDFRQMDLARDWGGKELRELNEVEWEGLLDACLEKSGKSGSNVRREIKSAPWKAAIGWWMKKQTSVNNRWLGENLNMGAPGMVSRLVGDFAQRSSRVKKPYERVFTSKS